MSLESHCAVMKYYESLDALESNGIEIPLDVLRFAYVVRDQFYCDSLQSRVYKIQNHLTKLHQYFRFGQRLLEKLERCRDKGDLKGFFSHLEGDHLDALGW